MIGGLGVVLAGLFLIVLINIDMGGETQVSANDPENVVDIIEPQLSTLNLDSIIDPRGGQLVPQNDLNPQLPSGSWIRFVDPQTGDAVRASTRTSAPRQYSYIGVSPGTSLALPSGAACPLWISAGVGLGESGTSGW